MGNVRPGLAGTLIESALVLLADHELNVSTLAARTAASGRASPYHAVLAGLAAHALEQYRTGGLLRPRARYVGPVPATDT